MHCTPALQRRKLSVQGRIYPAPAIPRAAGRFRFGVFSQDVTIPGNNTWDPSVPFLSAISPSPYMRPSGFCFTIFLLNKFVVRADASHPKESLEGIAVSWFAKLEAFRS